MSTNISHEYEIRRIAFTAFAGALGGMLLAVGTVLGLVGWLFV